MYPQNSFAGLNKYLNVVVLILAAMVIGVVGWSLLLKQQTGLLKVTTFSDDAVVSVSQNGKNAQIIGKGTVSVRLAPGNYEVAAISPDDFSSHQVTVTKNQTVPLRLTDTKPPVPSVEDVDWGSINLFYNYGLTEAQITDMEILFFKYKPSASHITFDESSVTNGFRDLTNDAAPFSLNFSGTIDGKRFKAVVSYPPSDLGNLDLTISDPTTKAQLYHGTTMPSVPNR
jgi:hypothetical protein